MHRIEFYKFVKEFLNVLYRDLESFSQRHPLTNCVICLSSKLRSRIQLRAEELFLL